MAGAGSKKSHSYRSLPTQFPHGEFLYRQIAREGNAAIYEQTWNGSANSAISYEVVRIRRHDGFQIGRRFVEAAEIYPSSKAWGTDGFTIQEQEAAFEKLRQIINRQKSESANP